MTGETAMCKHFIKHILGPFFQGKDQTDNVWLENLKN